MAFNPFHRFRKHQKAFMVFLTVMTMIIFVFSFGAGDVVHRGLAWFGNIRGSGKVVTTLYGSKIRESEIRSVQDRREAAHKFMIYCLQVEAPLAQLGRPDLNISGTLVAAVRSLNQQFQKAKGEDTLPFPLAVQPIVAEYLARNDPLDRTHFFMTLQTLTPEQRQEQVDRGLRNLRDQFDHPGDATAEQLHNMETVVQALAFEGWTWSTKRGNNELFFGGHFPFRTDELLDFLIWKHQADRMGIEMTEADVIREVNQATGNQNVLDPEQSFERNDVVLRFATPTDRQKQARPGATAGDLLQALRDEFRVQMAREALIGHGSGVRAFRNEAEPVRVSPAAATPDQFLQYFREQRTTLKATFLPITVEDFVPYVTQQPTEQELRDLYNQGKDRVAEPDSDKVGFREPRRIQLQFASLSPESTFYKKAGREMAEHLSIYSDPARSAALRVAAGFNTYATGVGLPPWAGLGLAIVPSAVDPLREEYETYRNAEKDRIRDGLGSPFDLSDRKLPSSRPEFATAAVGQFLAAGGGTISQLSGLATLPGADALYRQATVFAFGSSVLAGGASSPLIGLPTPVAFYHSPRPQSEVQPFLLQRYEEKQARDIMRINLEAFLAELPKLKDKPAEAQQYVKKSVPKFGLENFQATAGPESRYQIVDDPAYKTLDKAFEDLRKQNRGSTFLPQYPPLVDSLFNETAPISTYQPTPFAVGKDTWVFWKTQDKPAHERSFVQVRDEVLAAWRLGRARTLAADRAQKILQALQAADHPDNEQEIRRILREQRLADQPKLGEPFELKGISHLVRKDDLIIGRMGAPEYRPYQVPADKIPYPPEDFIDRLMTLKKPGDTLILRDRPVKHYYVAVLDVRDVPQRSEFFELYDLPALSNPIWRQMMDQRRTDYQRELMKQLRAEAGPVNSEGNLEVASDFHLRGDAGGGPASED
jgi:hypothetical protein